MKWKYVWGWFPLLAIAFINGTIRQIGYQELLGELNAHQVSTAIGMILFAFYFLWIDQKWKPVSVNETMKIGFLWVILTIIFEFGMGVGMGRPWEIMVHDYNLAAGRVWVVILAWVAIGPSVVFWWRKKRE
ncbi:MAG: hypothetical protein LCH54_06765 [Bacteroidetes bacterium]|nr:hypothetical protein [Bacteroidota bacterium]